MESNHPIKSFIKDKKYNHVYLSINSKTLSSKLREYDLFSNKSLSMGNIIKYIPLPLVPHFLRGYCDGDGCIFYGKRYKSGTKYNVIIIGTKEFLETSFCVHCKTNNTLYKYKTCEMYAFRISKKEYVDNFIDYIYKDSIIHSDRKYKRAHVKPS